MFELYFYVLSYDFGYYRENSGIDKLNPKLARDYVKLTQVYGISSLSGCGDNHGT